MHYVPYHEAPKRARNYKPLDAAYRPLEDYDVPQWLKTIVKEIPKPDIVHHHGPDGY